MEAAPVKVGETSRPMESQETGDVEKQIMEPLAKALERGDSKVEIQLTPENLGTVKVELTRHADGSLQVVLQAENPHTQSLLDRHAADLQGALHQQNQEPVKVVVQHQEESQHNENYQDENGRQGHQQEQRRQEQKRDSRDFMHQLRLGLTPVE